MNNSFLPNSTQGGITTASNASVTGTSAELTLPAGAHLLVSVGLAAGIFVRFGIAGTGVVTSSNGFFLPLNSVTTLSVPTGANTLLHIDSGTNSTISILGGLSGT